MALFIEKVHICVSALTKTVYACTVNKDNITMGNKVDRTNEFFKAVMEFFYNKNEDEYIIKDSDGNRFSITIKKISSDSSENK